MSLVGDRAAFAAALTAVDGVNGYAQRPKTPIPGDAWVLLGALERADGLVFTVNWRVLVFLPQDEVAASEWIDAHHEDLVDALEPLAFVERLEPVVIPANGVDQYHLQITMRSE